MVHVLHGCVMMSSKKLHDNEKKPLQLADRFNYLKKLYNLNDTDLCLKLGISRGYVGNISAGKVHGKGDTLWLAVRRVWPEWEIYLRGETDDPPMKTYVQEEEHMLPQKGRQAPDSGPGQLQIPDFSAYRVTKLVEPEEGRREALHAMLDVVLSGDDVELKKAFTSILEQIVLITRQIRRSDSTAIKKTVSSPAKSPEHRSPSSKPD